MFFPVRVRRLAFYLPTATRRGATVLVMDQIVDRHAKRRRDAVRRKDPGFVVRLVLDAPHSPDAHSSGFGKGFLRDPCPFTLLSDDQHAGIVRTDLSPVKSDRGQSRRGTKLALPDGLVRCDHYGVDTAAFIRQLEAHNLTVPVVAELLDISEKTVTRVRTGKRPLSIPEAITLADACGIGIDDLIGRATPSEGAARVARARLAKAQKPRRPTGRGTAKGSQEATELPPARRKQSA